MPQIKLTASQAIDEIKKVIRQMRVLKKEGKSAGTTIKSLETRLNNLKSKLSDTNKRMRSLNTQLKTQKSATRKLRTEARALSKAQQSNSTSTNKATKSSKSNTVATKGQAKATNSLVSSLGNMIKAFGFFLAARYLTTIIQDSLKLVVTFDSLAFAMKSITNGIDELNSSQRFLIEISQDFGANLIIVTNRYIKFLAAAKNSGLALGETEKIFRNMTKVSGILGLRTHELEGIFLALEQMLSKGKVTTEELRRQLGERLPGAMGIMAASMGVTLPKLDEMLKKGQVLAAEVLPNFADAVEIAFGAQFVDRIDTLIAKQNRLTTTWQIFIKTISEGDSIIKQVWGGMLELITDIVKVYTIAFADADQKLQLFMIGQTKREEDFLDEQSRKIVEAGLAEEKTRIGIQKRIEDAKFQITLDASKKNKKLLDELQREALLHEKVITKEKKKFALEQIETTREQVKLNTEQFELAKERLETRKEEERIGTTFLEKGQKFFKEIGGEVERVRSTKLLIKDLEKASILLGINTTQLEIFKRLLEESTVEVPDPKVPTTTTKIDTSDLDLQIQLLKNQQLMLQQIVDDEKRSLDDRLGAQAKFYELSEDIAVLNLQKGLRHAKENENKRELAYAKHWNEIIKIGEKSGEAQEKIIENVFKDVIEKVKKERENELNKEISLIKLKYAKLGTLTKEEERLMNEEIADVRLLAQNQIIIETVKHLRELMDILEISGELRVELEEKIQALLAGIRLKSSNDDESEFISKLKKLQEFINEVEALVSASFDRKIENINAEIKAEEDKFDKLIKLAHDDDAQREALEQRKQLRIEKLEAKRLKAEQRRARFNKAVSLANIAINTAEAVSKVLGQTGIFGIAASIPIIALGALQAATVLATPVPQYKEGLKNSPKDHVGMINDGTDQEYVERSGKILTTDTANALIQVRKGDTIHKNYDEMTKNSKLFSVVNNNGIRNQFKTEDLGSIIKTSIEVGFRKAKINNKIVFSNRDNSYRDSQSRWNN